MLTGVPGFDDILAGGFPARRIYLIQGDPGAGKTTLALRFLLEGVQRGERSLYVTFSESSEELADIARSHRWSLEGLSVLEISSDPAADESDTTLYQPAEVELGARMRALLEQIDRLRPARIVLDSCSELRLLAQSPLRYRRQILAMKQRLVDLGCTILLLDNPQPSSPDTVLQSVVHGVVAMEQLSPLYGAERRRLRVVKLRGLKYRGGFHDFIIKTGGVEVFPRLVAAEHHREFVREPVSSGLAEVDSLLGGGPDRGSSLLLMGPSGAGKSALAAQFALAAANRGERSAVFAFDESRAMYLARARSLGLDLQPHLDSGRIALQQIDPAELSPGEFSHRLRAAAEVGEARLVFIDSLNGYLNAMPEENFVALQLHELLAYLSQRGILTVMTLAQHGLVGSENESPLDVSYLADTILLFRYFEIDGQVRKAISAVKKRSGRHKNTIRELLVGEGGVRAGPVLERLQGVLTGRPALRGEVPGGRGA
ncbi:ATPase domain-containing protein [Anaeromyxobacter paludicola]|uniref:ATPase domain-containing protein n=1 Tax=Anaeromyxobacter paludicola TaxID=2918171 RepID=UPI0020C07FF6|nr:ATPase domain-containing protein [Anaeromyxobacter paludicola]